MKIKSFQLIVLALFFAISCTKETNTPTPVNEEELITSVYLDFINVQTGDTTRFSFVDLDGDGGKMPEITNDTLQDSSNYRVLISFFNEAEIPVEDITQEVIDEGDEHQVFYMLDSSLELTMNYAATTRNTHVDGRPIGIEADAISLNASMGDLKIILRHEPNKAAMGVSNGDISNAGGETDIEVSFDVVIE